MKNTGNRSVISKFQEKDPTGFLMSRIFSTPRKGDIIDHVKSATQKFWPEMKLNCDEIDWNSMEREVRVADVVKNPKAALRKAAFIAAEYLLRRRMLGRRCASESQAHDLHEWAIRVASSANTFDTDEFAYYAQVLKEAKLALDSGSPDVAAKLVSYVRNAFEVTAADWDPSLLREDLALEEVSEPQEQSNQYWGEAGIAPQQMLDPNMFDPSALGPQEPTPQQLQSEDYWNEVGGGPKPMEMLEEGWIDPTLGEGLAPAASDPASQDYWESMGVAPGDVPKQVWSRLIKAVRKAAAEERQLVKFTPPNYDLVLGDMVKAEKEGYDTFPRPYIHVLKNYIMARVATASENAWLPHLVNDGFVINRMGINRGRSVRAASSV